MKDIEKESEAITTASRRRTASRSSRSKSSRGSSGKSSKSSRGSSGGSNTSIKDQAIIEKMKVTELLVPNFVGVKLNQSKAFQEMDHQKIPSFLQGYGLSWIKWKHNPPAASHMGGIWEKQIRSARNILAALTKTHGKSLGDESLRSLMTEVKVVSNSTSSTAETVSDSNSLIPTSPSHLLSSHE